MSVKPVRSPDAVRGILLGQFVPEPRRKIQADQLPGWLLQPVPATLPFSVCRPSAEWVSLHASVLQGEVLRILQLPRAIDVARAFQQIARDSSVDPVAAGQCGLQAALAWIDAGEAVRGWSLMQHSISQLSQARTDHRTSAAIRTTDWLAFAAGALAVGETHAAQEWLRRSMFSFQHRLMDSVIQSTAGQRTARAQSCRLMGDLLALRSALSISMGSPSSAIESLCAAVRFHHDADDHESIAGDHVLLARCQAIRGDFAETCHHVTAARRALADVCPHKATFRTSVLWLLTEVALCETHGTAPEISTCVSDNARCVESLLTGAVWN